MNRRLASYIEATNIRKYATAFCIIFAATNVGLYFTMAIDETHTRERMISNNNSTTGSVRNDGYDLMGEDQSWSPNILKNLCCSSCLEKFSLDSTGDLTSVLEGSAFDVVVVEGEDGSLHQNSDFLVSFKGENEIDGNDFHNIVMEVDQENDAGTKAWFPIIRYPHRHIHTDPSENENDENDTFDEERFWGCCHPSAGSAKPGMISNFNDGGVETNDDPSSALKSFLKPGRNPIRYLLLNEQQIVGIANANIFLWKQSDSVVVSDIDGTITVSNARGILGTIITNQYTKVCHVGICNILSTLSSSSQIVYVTSRPIALVNQTRQFLSSLKQGNKTLPDGPLLGFGGNLHQLLLMELVSKTTQKFKTGKLWQQIVQPFRRATNNDPDSPVFVAGFGNNFMDMQSYHAVGMDLDRIFKINKKSQIITFDKPNMTSPQSNSVELAFHPHQWYKDRIGTKYDGYTDPRLISRLVQNELGDGTQR